MFDYGSVSNFGDGGWVWDAANGTRDLNSLVPSEWTITSAASINDSGQILAKGSNSTTGFTGVVVLTPNSHVHIELATDPASSGQPNQAMLALASATDANGNSLDMQDAAQQLGFDHFNWLQIIVSDPELSACSKNMSLAGCAGYGTISGTVPVLPSVDPPPGGWAYEYFDAVCPGLTCPFSYPIQDYWPMYWDEYYFDHCSRKYVADPAQPEYLWYYQVGNRLAPTLCPVSPVNPSQALGYLFVDRPATNGIVVPGTANQMENISFVTSLVGVNGICNTLTNSNCTFQIIPGTTFQWSAARGAISFQPLTFANNTNKQAGFPIVNPVDLTGNQLASSIISVNQFLALAGLTTEGLAAMGGSAASISASLIPSEAAALAKAAKVIPSAQIYTMASGLVYSRVAKTFNGTVTITNISTSTLNGPFEIVFTSLTKGVTVANATGTFNGIPFITVPGVTSLAPGQAAMINVQFTNPSNVKINFTPVVYSGSLN